jgi:hypothetical protein
MQNLAELWPGTGSECRVEAPLQFGVNLCA